MRDADKVDGVSSTSTRARTKPLGRMGGIFAGLATVLNCAGCASLEHGLMAPGGPIASDERFLFFLSIALILICVLPVLVLTPWLAWRYRRNTRNAEYRPKWEFSRPVEFVIWGVPIAVTAVLVVILWVMAYRLDPYRALPSDKPALEVEAISLDWKWLFIYPEQHVAAVNELAIPVGRPVHLRLTSDSVMQSLMIPSLAGQIYTMAGMQTQLYIQADHAGNYRGENTQYNGEGFQKQKFQTLAMSDADFAHWVAQARSSGNTLDCASFRELQKREVLSAPRLYQTANPGLFHWVIDKYRIHPQPACRGYRREKSHDG